MDDLPGLPLLPDPLRVPLGMTARQRAIEQETMRLLCGAGGGLDLTGIEAARLRATQTVDDAADLARRRTLRCFRCQITVESSVPPQQARCPTCGGPMERSE